MNLEQPFRLATGGAIDRSRAIRFRFNGVSYTGHPGDTLASALMANGVRLVGRSFKYHRPRGIVSAGVEEPNAIVQLDGDDDEPHARATTLLLRAGLSARSVKGWPSVGFDLGAANDRLSPLLAAGFYYKTFMWPSAGWNFYARFIRRMAGLGTAPGRADEQAYEKRFHHCDVLVAGAGPAGLHAALATARSGARVMLVDDAPVPGGMLRDFTAQVDGRTARAWVADIVAELDGFPDVLRLTHATVAGYYDHNLLTIIEQAHGAHAFAERLWKVRARQVVLATGASERPLVFANNDRPGVMQPGAALAYVHRHGVAPGRRAVVVTNNNSTYATVRELIAQGLEVPLLADVRRRPAQPLKAELTARGVEVLGGHAVVDVTGTRTVRAVEVAAPDGRAGRRRVACDLVLCSGGWNPRVHLHSQSGARPAYDEQQACFVPGTSVQGERSAGACNGAFDLAACLTQGWRAGTEACRALGFYEAAPHVADCSVEATLEIEPCWEIPPAHPRAKAFVDLQNDVTADDIRLAQAESFRSVEHVKRYTTAGMGTDQGKLGNVNLIGILSQSQSCAPGEIGTTTYRPPYTPVSFGAIAGKDKGELLLPARRTAITDWIENAGAVMFEAGGHYRRPSHFPQAGEDVAASVAREVRACRTNAGLYDGSPLGKFELRGPDAVTLLNRVYANRWDDLETGHGRFGWMLREDGRLLDDGVTFRLGPDRYWMFCATGAADHVYMHLERLLQLEWPGLEVYLTVVTSQWTNLCVCGPKARAILEHAGVDASLAPAAFPFMGVREMQVGGIAARVARVGYTGELSFEINVPARHGLSLWETLIASGKAFGLHPVGSQASLVMRCEKGFVAAGFEGDGIVNPFDAGVGWAVDLHKGDFIGRRSLEKDLEAGGVRPNVVGLLPDDASFVPAHGTPLVELGASANAPPVIGHITQACYSPTLERSIALAVLNDGRRRLGQRIAIAAIDRRAAALVAPPVFVDPHGERMRA
ncbi:MAG: sarcosine oxidase subunit alpha family protein [Gammaproteobacteria bacterium]